MKILLAGKKIALDPAKAFGKGGEADVFDLGQGTALKLYKQPDHPDFDGFPDQQAAAQQRLDMNQRKLPLFPKQLPERVVVPDQLATDASTGRIAGYSMKLVAGAEPLLRYSERGFRQTAGIKPGAVVEILRDLHASVRALHRGGVVIGDFNDLNVLVAGQKAHLIDADSFQFGAFLCPMFTVKFVDPALCAQNAKSLDLMQPHNRESDWYAFAVMLMQSLLYVHPYGGIYKPKDPTRRMLHDERPLQRITVFNPEVVYPKPALHFSILPDEVLDFFHRVFEQDQRGEVPERVLDAMEWSVCPVCGTEHARRICPHCVHTAPAAIKSVTRVRGTVTATRVFKTPGVILHVALDRGQPRWLYHENNAFKREDGSTVSGGPLAPGLRYRIVKQATVLGRDGQFAVLETGKPLRRQSTDAFRHLPMFDVNARHCYWALGGQLFRDGTLGPEYIGDVLPERTVFWVGDQFGFGFYRAERLSVAFVFDANQRGINDRVKLPRLRGELIDAHCVFAGNRAWFFTAAQENGRHRNQCTVLDSSGAILATAEAEAGDGSWLAHIRGKCGAGEFLFAPTDAGVVRLKLAGGTIALDREFPDTEPFVDADSELLASPHGLVCATKHEIQLLAFS